ncbi:putative uncharacterized protein DDB_G0286901 [Lacerta agilis]|uniref:putative uncharacterized protein DDB_G0286901 n=1 Tax=Lacerta agilis TaxID=80427 RepID=UPI0014199D05|nr:putative uncharacterized protein DDB_G0286901 [Lacerta agilis]
MKFQVAAAFLGLCLLSLCSTQAAPANGGSFDGNSVGSGSFNNNGNQFWAYGGNSGSFDNNKAGDNSFNNNGNDNDDPIVWY